MERTEAREILRQIGFTRTIRERNAAKYQRLLAEQDEKISQLEAKHAALLNEGTHRNADGYLLDKTGMWQA